jgi:hypothetical protein
MPTTKTVYIQANDIGEQLITPKGVIVRFDEALTTRLQTLRALCRTHGLVAVSIRQSPDGWLPAGVDDELRMNAPRMVVTCDEFWFEDQPKHARDHVECIPVGFDALLAWLATGDDTLIVGDDDEFDEYIKEVDVISNTVSEAKLQIGRVERAIESIYSTDLIRSAMASVAATGDVFTDAPESAGSVAAAQNLQVLAGMLGGSTETVAKGKLLAGASVVSDVDIRADGSLVVNLPSGFDTSSRAWTVVTSAGTVYRVKHFGDEPGEDGKWVIEEAGAFYADLLRPR